MGVLYKGDNTPVEIAKGAAMKTASEALLLVAVAHPIAAAVVVAGIVIVGLANSGDDSDKK